jgi:Coenzyme PQQ synthesis protein D (PqqD)
MAERKIFKKNPSVIFRKIGDELILLHIDGKSKDTDRIFVLKGCGRRIWEFMDGKLSLDSISKKVMKEFDTGKNNIDDIRTDIGSFFNTLEDKKFVMLVK